MFRKKEYLGEENNKNNKYKLKIKDKISLKMRRRNFVNNSFTFFIVIDLIIAFLAINLIKESFDLPEIDVTENKIYSLSDESKELLNNIEQDVKIYLFGIEEDDTVVSMVKQYCDCNEKITYEMLSKEENLEKVQELELENSEGYSLVVIESNGSHKLIDTSEFYTYDYSANKEIDLTEQILTNSILALISDNKPIIYFAEGHGEYTTDDLGLLTSYLKNEAMEYQTVNLMTQGKVPDDCSVLAIMSATTDLLESETQYIIDYINNGGNLFIAQGILDQGTTFPNMQKVLDLYGVTVENGVVIELSSSNTVSNAPYAFIPNASDTSEITTDINSSKKPVYLAYSAKINKLSDEELTNLNVTSEDLLTTSDEALFITDFSSSLSNLSASDSGEMIISSMFTKTISEGNNTDETTNENTDDTVDEENDNSIKSKLIIVGSGNFVADEIVEEFSQSYPISYLGSNKDFAINSLSYLSDKDMGLTIKKDTAGTSYVYTATTKQNLIVIIIIFTFPILIILAGIIVWHWRKKRK